MSVGPFSIWKFVLCLFVYHAVAELGELSAVPAACGSHEVTCDALELVDVLSSAVRTFLKTLVCILETAVHAAVAVVVHRAVADVISVHKVNDRHDRLRIVGRVTIDLDIEDVSATCECVVWSLDLSLVLRGTFIIYRHMVGIRVIILVRNARYDSELLPVTSGEASCKTFCRV